MTLAPLDRLDEILSPCVRAVTECETPIPTIAVRAKAKAKTTPALVRGDIGQVAGVEPDAEVLYGPPSGLDALRDALAESWNRTYNLTDGKIPGLPAGLTAAHVAVCTGAAEGLSLLFRCFAEGRAVGLPRGHWENYTNGVNLAGGRTLVVDYFDTRGELNAEAIANAVRVEGLAVLVANFPCNPTGAVLTAEECARLGRVAEDTGVLLIADEVYARLRYDGRPPVTLLRYAPGHTVGVSSASKEYLLPGARVGWVLSTRPRLTDVVLRKLIRANTASPGVLGQERVLQRLQSELDALRMRHEPPLIVALRGAMRERRDALLDVLARHGMDAVGRRGHLPAGTIFLMASLPAWWRGTDESFVDAALEAGCVSAIPGAAFGLPGAIRLSYGAMTLGDITRLDANLQLFRDSLA